MEQNILRPCGKCGGNAVVCRIAAHNLWFVGCDGAHCANNVGVSKPLFAFKDDAVKAWNREQEGSAQDG